jgi:hypothetical protein
MPQAARRRISLAAAASAAVGLFLSVSIGSLNSGPPPRAQNGAKDRNLGLSANAIVLICEDRPR